MDFSFSEEQKMLQSQAQEIALMDVSPRASDMDSYTLFPWEGLKALSEADLMGMMVPPAYGGAGSDIVSFIIVTQELARYCANTALLFVTQHFCEMGLLAGGQEDLKKKWLPMLASGEKLAAFAATETDCGSNILAAQTTAQSQGDSYTVNGTKVYITAADDAELYLTVVRTSPAPGPQSLSILAIEKETQGLSFGRKYIRMGLNGSSNGEVILSNCEVPKANLVGPEGGYMPMFGAMSGVGLLGASAIAVGLAQTALAESISYGKQRVVAGQPLGNYQAVQFMVSEMSALVDAGHAALYQAGVAHLSAPPGPPFHAMKAKLFTTDMALRVTDLALQVHGGAGYT
ncbi:MAG: acyl-CoA dehydrogenase family protein, partial [Dehalococcoidia bacterium]|nr:acyl-CoA dehydrogenase family protein [Dehalococcoidia bacterium]